MMKTIFLLKIICLLSIIHDAWGQSTNYIVYCNSIEQNVFEWDKREWVYQGNRWVLSEFRMTIPSDSVILIFPIENKQIIYCRYNFEYLVDPYGIKWKYRFDDDGLRLLSWDENNNQHEMLFEIYHIYSNRPKNTYIRD